jgi:TP901 family phage tail tape measure protein
MGAAFLFTRELIPHLEPLSPPEIQDGLFFMESIGLEAFINMSAFRTAYKEYNSSVSKMNSATETAASGITGKFQSMGNSVLGIAKGLGTVMVAGATAAAGAITAFVGSGVKLATDLEAQMAGVRAILGITADDLELIRQKTIDLGLNPNLKVSAVEAAGAIEMLARNGLGMQEILDGAAESTILLANATGADFSKAANIATDTMAIFNIEAKDMISAVDGISSVTVASKFDMNDYALAIGQSGGAVKIAGVEFTDFNAVLAAVSPLFKSGAEAGTAYRSFLQRSIPQTAAAKEAMNALGLEFFDTNGNMRSAAEIAGELNEAFYGTSTAMVEVGGRTAEQNAELQRLSRIYESTQQTVADYEAGIKGAGLSEAARAAKLEDLYLQLNNTQTAMQPLLAIQGELVATTRQLTEAERLQYLTTIFGADAMNIAAGMAGYTEEEFAALKLGTGLAIYFYKLVFHRHWYQKDNKHSQ